MNGDRTVVIVVPHADDPGHFADNFLAAANKRFIEMKELAEKQKREHERVFNSEVA